MITNAEYQAVHELDVRIAEDNLDNIIYTQAVRE
jgi:hypothetical protein